MIPIIPYSNPYMSVVQYSLLDGTANLREKKHILARNLRELAREAYLGIPQGSPKDPLGIR